MSACADTGDDAIGEPGDGALAAPLVVGLDIGGTKTLAAAVDQAGRIVAEVRLSTDASGGEGLRATAAVALQRVAVAVGGAVDAIAAVGVGVPGIVDHVAGTVRYAVNLGVGAQPVDLAEPLRRMVGGPVLVANDVNLAALG